MNYLLQIILCTIILYQVMLVSCNDNALKVSQDRNKQSQFICTSDNLKCECCGVVTFPNDRTHSVCVILSTDINALEVSVQFLIDGKLIKEVVVSPKSFPVCVPFPQVPFIQLCLVANEVYIGRDYIRFCTTYQVRLGVVKIYEAKLPCMEIRRQLQLNTY